MRVVQVAKAKGPFEMVERPMPDAGPGQVRIKVQACGVCHSDSVVKDGLFPNIPYPRVPGHEVAGLIDSVGSGVTQWTKGDRVGVGWHGGYCGVCDPCRHGDFFGCVLGLVTGITHDGGYGEYMIAPANSVALLPDELSAIEAAPLMCAGITTFNALRNCGARPGDLVAVLGLGGLGHLGVQYAAKMGFHTVAIARGEDKKPLATKLGAAIYLDSQAVDVSKELQKLGGAKAILATVTNGPAMEAVQAGLGLKGRLMVIGAVPSMKIDTLSLLTGNRTIEGWYSGTSIDSQETAAFSAQTGIRSMNEVYPFEKAAEAYDRMMSGKARFRVVLEMPK